MSQLKFKIVEFTEKVNLQNHRTTNSGILKTEWKRQTEKKKLYEINRVEVYEYLNGTGQFKLMLEKIPIEETGG